MPSKKTLVGLEILRMLARKGYRIFTRKDVLAFAKRAGIKKNYIPEAITHLKNNNWIVIIKRGVYAFTPVSGFSTPPHEFEIAQALVFPSAISHWTAMHFHHLTQQTPNIIYSIVPKNISIPRKISKDKYHFIKIASNYFFGIKKVWIEETQIEITDKERTLLDGLRQPQYCGNFEEVLHAFEIAMKNELDIKKITSYALRLEKVISMRLGCILERLGVPSNELKILFNIKMKDYNLLNPGGRKEGRYNKTWMIRENI